MDRTRRGHGGILGRRDARRQSRAAHPIAGISKWQFLVRQRHWRGQDRRAGSRWRWPDHRLARDAAKAAISAKRAMRNPCRKTMPAPCGPAVIARCRSRVCRLATTACSSWCVTGAARPPPATCRSRCGRPSGTAPLHYLPLVGEVRWGVRLRRRTFTRIRSSRKYLTPTLPSPIEGEGDIADLIADIPATLPLSSFFAMSTISGGVAQTIAPS